MKLEDVMPTRTSTGWIVFIASLGMMATLTANDIANLEAWESATSPKFLGGMLAHFGAVVTAFVGGKLMPNYYQKGE